MPAVRNKASKVVTLNAASENHAQLAIEASASDWPEETIRQNIKLLEVHMTYQPATPEGEARYQRAQRTILNLRTQLEELQESKKWSS